MVSRREFLAATAALASITGSGLVGRWSRAAAQQRMSEDDLLGAPSFGNLTLLHVTDIHAQLKPVYFREPAVNIGIGAVAGLPPHLSGADFLKLYRLEPGSPEAYALTCEDYAALAERYGKMGGLDRIATIVKRARAERGEENVILLDGGDTWQGSFTANATNGADMIACMNLLKPDAMTGHWEFTYGADRVSEAKDALAFPFLGSNIFDTEWNEPAFEAWKMFERGGAKVAVIGQAFPYTPIANPRWLIPGWSFGIREEEVAKHVEAAKAAGADVVILLSHNGFDVDRAMASRVPGIDVILTGHTHDALPEPVKVGKTVLIASGSNGKFVSRLDLDIGKGELKDLRYRLIPVFSDVIPPDGEMAAKIDEVRAPYADQLGAVLGRTEGLLYRRGNFNGTWDDLICDALLSERDAEIALSPGFRWGTSLPAGRDITVEDLHNACAMSYPAAYRTTMSGAMLKTVLEDVADNLFNADPYYQQGGDMVRVGCMGFAIDPAQTMGSRISDMVVLKTETPVEAARDYVVAGWASVNEGTEGPPIWDVVSDHLKANPVYTPSENRSVKLKS